jgi:hypothetical protein
MEAGSVEHIRGFWFSDESGPVKLGSYLVSRKDIHVYGGPNPSFKCPACRNMEWLSRVNSTSLFKPHGCSDENRCRFLCEAQTNTAMTHLHQNFDFSFGCDSDVQAPKCLFVAADSRFHYRIHNPNCDSLMLVLRRQLAQACQVDVVLKAADAKLEEYDFVLVPNMGNGFAFPKTSVPVVMYGHDLWLEKPGYQGNINRVQPDVFLTPYPSAWKKSYRFPSHTEVVFYPQGSSRFFTRTNLDRKKLDLLVIGATSGEIYAPRAALARRARGLRHRFNVEVSSHAGHFRANPQKSVVSKDGARYLNKWSEYLGSAKYVAFGAINRPTHQFLVGKYFEVLGCGAVPILPVVPELDVLGLKAFEHYIPLTAAADNNKLAHFLGNYDKYKHIACSAVEWHKAFDRRLFDGFEELVHDVTGGRYPKRLKE